jgi:hypothetical protein
MTHSERPGDRRIRGNALLRGRIRAAAVTAVGSLALAVLATGCAGTDSAMDDGASGAVAASTSPSPSVIRTLDPTTTAPPTTEPPTTTASAEPVVTTSPPTTRPAPRPTTHRPVVPRPTTPRPVTHAATVAPPPDGGDILSPSGKHYAAGQFCKKAHLGLTTHDAHGAVIKCVPDGDYNRWTHV